MASEQVPSISVTEQDFYAWRYALPGSQERTGPNNPLVQTLPPEKVVDLLESGDMATLSTTTTPLLDSARLRWQLSSLLKDDVKQVWINLDDSERMRVHEMAYGTNGWTICDIGASDNRLAYQNIYFGDLIIEGFTANPDGMAWILGKNAESIAGAYDKLHQEEAQETATTIQQACQRLICALRADELPYISSDWAMERIRQLQFIIQDPLTFKSEWTNNKEGNLDADEVAAYYNADNHKVVFPSLSNDKKFVRKKRVLHEVFHALSAVSYVERGAEIRSKRVGLSNYAPKKADDDSPSQPTHTVLNEAVVESRACMAVGLSPDSRKGLYRGWRKVARQTIRLATKLRPDIPYEDMLIRATFEQPQTTGHSPGRWPARKAFGAVNAEIFRPGFQNQLDCYVAVHGVEKTLRALRTNWRKITFDKASNHLRHNPYIT